MNNSKIALSVALVVLTGCATTTGSGSSGQTDNKTATAGVGAAIGCVGGAVLAKLAGGKPLAGCAAGAMLGGLVGFEKARQEEIEAAKKVQAEVVTVVAGARSTPVVTEQVQVKDKASGEIKTVQALKELSIDLPLSQKDTPDFNQALDKVQKLAEKYADERGNSQVVVAMNAKDAKAQNFSEKQVKLKTVTGKGSVTLVRSVSPDVPNGFERITIKTNNSSNMAVS